MPSKYFKKIGISQTNAFAIHMVMYGTPLLFFFKRLILCEMPFYFERYIFSDWPYLTSLALLVFLDTLSGGIGALITPRVDRSGKKIGREFSAIIFYEKLAKKFFGISVYVLVIGVLKNTVINGEQNLLYDIIDSGFYSLMIGFEGASVLRNAYKIYPFEVIKIALRRLEVFYDFQKDRVHTKKETKDKL
jgi:hypothetical protein